MEGRREEEEGRRKVKSGEVEGGWREGEMRREGRSR